MREDAIREHLTPHPANVASNLHLAANAAKSEAAAAQSPAEAQAAHVIKSAADAAKALPSINAAIEQNERECVPFCVSHNFLSKTACHLICLTVPPILFYSLMHPSLSGTPSLPKHFRPMFISSSHPKSFRRRRSKRRPCAAALQGSGAFWLQLFCAD